MAEELTKAIVTAAGEIQAPDYKFKSLATVNLYINEDTFTRKIYVRWPNELLNLKTMFMKLEDAVNYLFQQGYLLVDNKDENEILKKSFEVARAKLDDEDTNCLELLLIFYKWNNKSDLVEDPKGEVANNPWLEWRVSTVWVNWCLTIDSPVLSCPVFHWRYMPLSKQAASKM